jgi:peptide/nickel transport system permease protein
VSDTSVIETTEPADEQAKPAKKRARRSIGFYLAGGWLGLLAFFIVFGDLLPLREWNDFSYDYSGTAPFRNGFIFGTSLDGMDILSGIINGTRISILVSFFSVIIGGGIGSLIGITSAYYRGKYDTVVNAVFNVMLSIPNLVLSLALLSTLAYEDSNNPTTTTRRVLVLILSLTIVIIPILGRIARASTLQWAGREFVLASRSMGTKNFTIIRKHILPNVAPAILSIGFLALGAVIIVEGSLAVLGIGIPGGASWGSMLATGRNNIEFSPHEVYIPAIFIALTVIACNWFGDFIRAQLDQRESKI